ncbi:MAG: hypothetical protein JSR27_05465 [Proteobacteria bacterium]|nr:hypothetical protein [Pseudomonadota bacterium]
MDAILGIWIPLGRLSRTLDRAGMTNYGAVSPARHTGMDCRYPERMDAILGIWIPFGRLSPTLDRAGMTNKSM